MTGLWLPAAAIRGEYSIVEYSHVSCLSLSAEVKFPARGGCSDSVPARGPCSLPWWMFPPGVPHIPKLRTCEQAKPNFPNSLLFTIQSLMAETDLFVWIFCHLWSNSFYLAVSLSVKYFLQILSGFFFPAIQGSLIFALFQCLLPRLILQLPGNSEFVCFVFILVIFEQLYISSPISVSHLSE